MGVHLVVTPGDIVGGIVAALVLALVLLAAAVRLVFSSRGPRW